MAFIQDKLNIQVSDDEIEARIGVLKASVLRENSAKVIRLRNGSGEAATKAS